MAALTDDLNGRVRSLLTVAGLGILGLSLPPVPLRAQTAESLVPATPSHTARVSYADGLLKIEAFDSTLDDILAKVASLLNVKIEVPDAVKKEKVLVTLGPGPSRPILANLFDESRIDYVIQDADARSGKIKSILLVERQKASSSPAVATVASGNPRSPNGRTSISSMPEPPSESGSPASAPEIVSAGAPPGTSAAPPPQPGDAPTGAGAAGEPADQSASIGTASTPSTSQPGMLNGQKVAPMNPPATLNSQNINQQLQQMYQQRVQANQQPAASPIIK
jgi:hypothetical protein